MFDVGDVFCEQLYSSWLGLEHSALQQQQKASACKLLVDAHVA